MVKIPGNNNPIQLNVNNNPIQLNVGQPVEKPLELMLKHYILLFTGLVTVQESKYWNHASMQQKVNMHRASLA